MNKGYILALAFVAISCMIMSGGCSSQAPSVNTSTATPTASPRIMATPSPAPSRGPGGPIYGNVYLNGTPVEDAKVKAVSADGAYRETITTNGSGAYVLSLPKDVQYNLTASYGWMRHTLWPVFTNDRYDISLNTTQKTMITGRGRVVGGPLGYNPSTYNFSTTIIEAVPANGDATIAATARSDGSYSLEIQPDVLYHLRGSIFTNVWFNYHNTERGGQTIDVRLDPDTTALIDYMVVLPA
jgi:hypothetical protein